MSFAYLARVCVRALRELQDIDEQLDQIQVEKARLVEAIDEDDDITDALDELREQLSHSKSEKLAQIQHLEQAVSSLQEEVGELSAQGKTFGQESVMKEEDSGMKSPFADSNMHSLLHAINNMWKKLEASSIEKLNVGQQEALGVKDLLKLSNAAIDAVSLEVKRVMKLSGVQNEELGTLLYDLIMDACSTRKRLNDYTEGILVQTAQKLDAFKLQARVR